MADGKARGGRLRRAGVTRLTTPERDMERVLQAIPGAILAEDAVVRRTGVAARDERARVEALYARLDEARGQAELPRAQQLATTPDVEPRRMGDAQLAQAVEDLTRVRGTLHRDNVLYAYRRVQANQGALQVELGRREAQRMGSAANWQRNERGDMTFAIPLRTTGYAEGTQWPNGYRVTRVGTASFLLERNDHREAVASRRLGETRGDVAPRVPARRAMWRPTAVGTYRTPEAAVRAAARAHRAVTAGVAATFDYLGRRHPFRLEGGARG